MELRHLVALTCLSLSVPALAHQPVMDMAPRWEDGFGVQLRHESYGSDQLRSGSEEISNPIELDRFVRKTWLEGVYTFERSKRLTFKLPYVDQKRIKNIGGTGVLQDESGFGDIIIAAPFKKYRNNGKNTSNFSITPSIRLPTGSSDGDFPISDGSVDFGLSVSYSAEGYPFAAKPKFKIYQLYDLYYWHNREGKRGMHEGDELALDVNIGVHPYHDNETNLGAFMMWDISARSIGAPHSATLTTASGGDRIHTGPVFVMYKDNVMIRAEYSFPVYENVEGITNSRGDMFNFGIGISF